MPEALDDMLQIYRQRLDGQRLVVLTGAGISAESGVPTFRGPEGYWTVGSQEYRPEQMATRAFFDSNPAAVWEWYLYRLGVCCRAQPNLAHDALARLDKAFEARLTLVTQNVDGLHLEAGSTPARTYQIHGNLRFARCSADCTPEPLRLADHWQSWQRHSKLSQADAARLRCDACGAWLRPHVLWFDETYDEPLYRFDSSLRAVSEAALLVVVGTSGATSLPAHMVEMAQDLGVAILDINTADNPFGQVAQRQAQGFHARGRADVLVPRLVDALV